MRARRRSPVQQSLPFPAGRGGARPGAGRPRLSPIPLTEHRRRAEHDPRVPAHVTIRLVTSRTLRTQPVLRAVRAVLRALHAQREGLRVTAFSLQHNHLHFIVEADSAAAFASGMRSLCIRIAMRANQALGRSGTLFADRYHVTPLRSPRAVRNAYAYVLLNRRRHLAERGHRVGGAWFDEFSSADSFGGWKEIPPSFDREPATAPPRTWLGSRGWRLHGLISCVEVPKHRAPKAAAG